MHIHIYIYIYKHITDLLLEYIVKEANGRVIIIIYYAEETERD